MTTNPENLIYLDNAATSFPKLDIVIEAMGTFYREYGMNPGRSGGDIQQIAADKIDDTRRALARLFGLDDWKRVVLTASATMASNIALQGVLEPGDHVVTTVCEHNSIIRPLTLCQQRSDIEITWVKPDARGLISAESILSVLRPQTRIVAVTHASNVTGLVQPIAEIGAALRNHKALFMVDCAQTAGMATPDMAACAMDMAIVAGHKSLHGPAGIGALLLSDRSEPRPVFAGGTGINSIDPHQPEHLPSRLESGTINLPGVAGLHAALRWIEANDMADQLQRLRLLQRRLADGLRDIEGLDLHGFQYDLEMMPTICFTLRDKDPAMVATFLDVDYGIISRSGLHCAPLMHQWLGTAPQGAIRLSPGLATSNEDIEKTIEAVAEIAALSMNN